MREWLTDRQSDVGKDIGTDRKTHTERARETEMENVSKKDRDAFGVKEMKNMREKEELLCVWKREEERRKGDREGEKHTAQRRTNMQRELERDMMQRRNTRAKRGNVCIYRGQLKKEGERRQNLTLVLALPFPGLKIFILYHSERLELTDCEQTILRDTAVRSSDWEGRVKDNCTTYGG